MIFFSFSLFFFSGILVVFILAFLCHAMLKILIYSCDHGKTGEA